MASAARCWTLTGGDEGEGRHTDVARRDPTLVRDQLPEMGERRVARLGFELVPGRAPGRQVGDEKRVDRGPRLRHEGGGDLPIQRTVDRRPHMACGAVERVEGG